MVPAMLNAVVHAAIAAGAIHAAAAAEGGVALRMIPARIQPVPLARLPLAAVAGWAMRRCGGAPARIEAGTAAVALDPACARLTVRDAAAVAEGRGPRPAPAAPHGGGVGLGDGTGWRLAGALLPALGGVVGSGGMRLGLGGEMPLARGARMGWHLAAPHDTRMAPARFAPETTVQARCSACGDEGEAPGAGIGGGRAARGGLPPS